MKILLLEDDVALNRAIKKITELDSHSTTAYVDGLAVYDDITDCYDLYILDINVPGMNGLEVLRKIHKKNSLANVIIISANGDVDSLTNAYKYGCVDYLKKPFHLEELRIKISKIKLPLYGCVNEVKLRDESLTLTKKEKDFLSLLLENQSQVVPYKTIQSRIYEENYMSMDSLRALVKRLRRKLADDVIVNILDEGYKIA